MRSMLACPVTGTRRGRDLHRPGRARLVRPRTSRSAPVFANGIANETESGRALAAGIGGGRWLPAIGSSDTHLARQIAIPHTVVLAGELSASAVLAGIRADRSWIARSPAVNLSLRVRTGDRSAGIGEQLETRGEPTVVRAVVSGVPSGTVSFHTDQGTVHREPGNAPCVRV